MTIINKDLVIAFLKETNIDIDFSYHLGHNDFDTADDIQEILQDCGAFDVEIMYYGSAIEYLMKNDNSLRESLEIASDMGFEAKNLNSEILASLLASQNIREEFSDIMGELENFIDELHEEEEEEEEAN